MSYPIQEPALYSYSPQEESKYFDPATQSIEMLKMKLMEKDKLIFSFSKAQKESEKANESLRRVLADKEDENQKLNLTIQDLTFQIKRFESQMNKNNEQIQSIKVESQQQISLIEKDKQGLLLRSKEMEKVIVAQENNLKNTYEAMQKISEESIATKKANEESLMIIDKYEKIFDTLKNDNKQIPSLKRKILDLENIIENLKGEMRDAISQREKITFEKDDLNSKLKLILSEQQREREKNENIFKLNHEYESLKKDYAVKEKEFASLNDKYKSNLKDSDNFIHIVTSELGQFCNYLESLNISTRTNMKLPLSQIKNFQSQNYTTSFSLKFEVVMKTIDTLKGKIVEIFNVNLNDINKLNDQNDNLKQEIKDVRREKDELEKTVVISSHKISENESKIRDNKNELNALNESYNKLKENYLKLKNAYIEFGEKNEKISNETNNFLTFVSQKLACDATFEGIKGKVNELCNEIDETKSCIMEGEKNQKESDEKIKTLTKENSEIKVNLQSLQERTNSKIESIINQKENEMKVQRNTLYNKIKSLTELLDESNKLIKGYENEVAELKARNQKLENNLKLLTNSHLELEQSINHNSSSLHCQIDEKDKKCNTLLRELELKDLQIQSLEKLINNQGGIAVPQMNENVGKIVNRGYIQRSDGQSNNSSCFVKNEEHEEELKKMMNGFKDEDDAFRGSVNTNNTNENNVGYINNNNNMGTGDENNFDFMNNRNTTDNANSTEPDKGTSSSLRIPGRLFKKVK